MGDEFEPRRFQPAALQFDKGAVRSCANLTHQHESFGCQIGLIGSGGPNIRMLGPIKLRGLRGEQSRYRQLKSFYRSNISDYLQARLTYDCLFQIAILY